MKIALSIAEKMLFLCKTPRFLHSCQREPEVNNRNVMQQLCASANHAARIILGLRIPCLWSVMSVINLEAIILEKGKKTISQQSQAKILFMRKCFTLQSKKIISLVRSVKIDKFKSCGMFQPRLNCWAGKWLCINISKTNKMKIRPVMYVFSPCCCKSGGEYKGILLANCRDFAVQIQGMLLYSKDKLVRGR